MNFAKFVHVVYKYGLDATICAMNFINRRKKEEVKSWLNSSSAVVLLGQRQVGKTTLAKEISRERDADYLNLSDLQTAASLDLQGLKKRVAESGKHLTIIDEIQTRRDLFPELMTIIDDRRLRGEGVGCFLLIGSGSLAVANKSSESLRGRVAYVDLDPIDVTEITVPDELDRLWLRGGLPGAFCASSDRECFAHLRGLVDALSMQDLRAEGAAGATPGQIVNILYMLASSHGGTLNVLKIAERLDLDRRKVNRCLGLLEELLIIRKLPPHGKRRFKNTVKTPKVYLCDSGLLHHLLRVDSLSGFDSHMTRMSWEGFAVENILRHVDLGVIPSFYRTRSGAKIDLLLSSVRRGTWAIEIKKEDVKASPLFHKAAMDTKSDCSFLVHGRVDLPRHRDERGTEIIPLPDMCREVAEHFGR